MRRNIILGKILHQNTSKNSQKLNLKFSYYENEIDFLNIASFGIKCD